MQSNLFLGDSSRKREVGVPLIEPLLVGQKCDKFVIVKCLKSGKRQEEVVLKFRRDVDLKSRKPI